MERNIGVVSERQFKILMEITRKRDVDGFPPTIRQMGEAAGINSTSVVNYNLNKLVQRGYLSRERKVSRGYKILVEPSHARLGFNPNEVFAKEPLVSEE